MRAGTARLGLPIAIASLLVLGSLLGPTLSGAAATHGGDSHLTPAFSNTMAIGSNCTPTNHTVFTQVGTTFTLVKAYTGAVLDQCNGSTLIGAGRTITVSGGGAGVLVLNAANITITGFNFTATGGDYGVETYDATNVSVVANNFTTASAAVYVWNSVSVSMSENFGAATAGLLVESSSSVSAEYNNFTGSITDGFQADGVTGLVLVGNNFSHAADPGLGLDGVTSVIVRGNQFTNSGSGNGMFLDEVAQGNFSSNNDSGNVYAIVTNSCSGLTFWNDTVNLSTEYPYDIGSSSEISILDSIGIGAMDGAELEGDNGVMLDDVDFAESGAGVFDDGSVGVTIQDSMLEDCATAVLATDAIGLSVIDSNLTHGNNGLVAQHSSTILVKDSNLSRANYPLYLTDGTTGVTVEGSQLDGAQETGVYLNGASDISIEQSSIRFAAVGAVDALSSPGVTISSTDMSDSAADPGLVGFDSDLTNTTTLANDSFEWLQSPVFITGSAGITITGSDLSNATSSNAVILESDIQILVAGCNFFNDSAAGIGVDFVDNMTVTDSKLADLQGAGFLVNNAENVVVTGNNFDNDGGNGVFLTGVQGFVASGNQLDNDSNAIFMSNGIDAVVANNTALADQDGGLIATDITGFDVIGNNISDEPDNSVLDISACSNFALTDNTFFDDGNAVDISGASQGTLIGNGFIDDASSFDLSSPVIAQSYHNDFISDQGWVIDGATLAWDDGYPEGGNYWSNYTGVDLFSGPGQNVPGADGLGDTPFVLDLLDIDHYPLMTPWSDHAAVFVSSGLPMGTLWSVVFNGTRYSTTTNEITVMSTVGVETSYTYSIPAVLTYVPSHAHGSGLLGDGLVVVDVTWAVPTYALTFAETGLPASTVWGVTINGTQYSGPAENFSLVLTNGTYPYTVDSVPGYTLTPTSGSITIAGTPQMLTLSFVPFTYNVTVTESGLPGGTGWGIIISGTHTTSTTTSITVFLANGSYAFTVDPVTGYTSAPAGGSWSISGGPLSVNVQFTSNSQVIPPPSGTISPTNPNLLPYYGIIIALGAAAAVGWILAARGRRDRDPMKPFSPEPDPPTPPGRS